MRFRHMRQVTSIALVASMLFGCMLPGDRLHYFGRSELKYYKDVATEIQYPVTSEEPNPAALLTDTPRTVRDRQNDEVWNLSLQEAIQVALANNRIIRNIGTIDSGNILANPDLVPSVYDPAIDESGVLFGRRGVEAALADFDTQFTTAMLWGRDERLQNSAFSAGAPGTTLTTDSGEFTTQLQKSFANGGQFTVNHDWLYQGFNSSALLFPSSYTGQIGANYQLPLWAGSGTEFTRIAGPTRSGFGGITGVSQGVVIARINTDIAIADFEANVRNLVKDVEDLYWELYLSYRLYHTVVVARNSALRTWREAEAKLSAGGIAGFKPADEAQARDQYYETRAATSRTLGQLYALENRFRRLLGLPVNDGRIIRPADEPIAAEFIPDWYTSLTEALTERVELRKQKWNIKSLELQLLAARSLTRPQLNFEAGYHVNGFGDTLLAYNDNDGLTPQGLHSAYETITQGNQTGWTTGLTFTMPIGFRSAHSQVRNYELRLAKARDILSAQELEISHELARAIQELTTNYQTARDNLNRREAAQRRVELFEAELEVGTQTWDEVLRAQRSLAEAERDYYTSLTDYNKGLVAYLFFKGTLLADRSIHLAESEWTPEAYRDALRRAWARSHALDHNKLKTEPAEFAVPKFETGYGVESFQPELLPPVESYDSNTVPTVPPTPQPPLPDDESAPFEGPKDGSDPFEPPNPVLDEAQHTLPATSWPPVDVPSTTLDPLNQPSVTDSQPAGDSFGPPSVVPEQP